MAGYIFPITCNYYYFYGTDHSVNTRHFAGKINWSVNGGGQKTIPLEAGAVIAVNDVLQKKVC